MNRMRYGMVILLLSLTGCGNKVAVRSLDNEAFFTYPVLLQTEIISDIADDDAKVFHQPSYPLLAIPPYEILKAPPYETKIWEEND